RSGWVEASKLGWFDYLDGFDQESGDVGAILDDLMETDDTLLLDGSLWLLRRLGVHPVVRGQHLGLQLVARTLSYCRNAEGDLAVLTAHPSSTWFGAPVAETSLIPYYRKVGFELHTASVCKDEPIMLAHFGAHLMPYEKPRTMFPRLNETERLILHTSLLLRFG